MRTLPERDVAALLEFTAELVASEAPEPFTPELLSRLAALVPADEAAYSVLDRAEHRAVEEMLWNGNEAAWLEKTPGGDEDWWRLSSQHPVCGHRTRTNEWTTTRMFSDFMTQRQLRRTTIWNELYRDAGINHWLDVGLRPVANVTRMFIFNRAVGDFDERDRLVLELLQPHLQRRYDRATAAAEAADALTTLDEGGSDGPAHVVLCSGSDVIEYASRASRRMLETYFRCTNGHLPDGVATALRRGDEPLVVEREGRRLTLRGATSSDLLVVLLSEEDVRLERLTPRQRTILEHVAQGQTDGEIATSVGIAAATVNKHLEEIFRRLEVHTRTAAAALVPQR
ncbi:MAG TPA: helix-turn-helix transcriptional regulator [Gaiellaceae bacterium]|nr:helix-turn-helix transcriptional regulator [Gaiellaceae bacterium]